MRASLVDPLTAAGHDTDNIAIEEVAAIRYSGQSYAIEIVDPSFDDPDDLGRAFLDRHDTLYGFATDEPWELVTVRQRASVPRTDHGTGISIPTGGGRPPVKTAACTFAAGQTIDVPRFDRATVAANQAIAGPAIVEDAWSTVVIPPGAALTADRAGNLVIETGADR
jgi:N-methylhydantoinase A